MTNSNYEMSSCTSPVELTNAFYNYLTSRQGIYIVIEKLESAKWPIHVNLWHAPSIYANYLYHTEIIFVYVYDDKPC